MKKGEKTTHRKFHLCRRPACTDALRSVKIGKRLVHYVLSVHKSVQEMVRVALRARNEFSWPLIERYVVQRNETLE